MNKSKLLILIAILSLVFTLTTVTYSWFLVSTGVDIDVDPYLTVEAKDELLISLDGGSTYNGSYTTNIAFGSVLDVSGNGLNLYNPTDFSGANQDVPTAFESATAMTLSSPLNDGHYLELSVIFRSKNQLSILLGSESTVLPAELNAETLERKSTYGNYTCDYIAGATRVAFLNGDKSSLNMLWIPNDTYELYNEAGASASFRANGTREASYKYYSLVNNAYVLNTYPASDIYTRKLVPGSTNTTVTSQGLCSNLVTLTKANEEDEFYTGTVVVRIWIEGTDRESRIALSGGKVSIHLVFVGYTKTMNSDWETSIATIAASNTIVNGSAYTGMYVNNAATITNESAWAAFNEAALTSGQTYYCYYPGTDDYLNSSMTYFTYTAS